MTGALPTAAVTTSPTWTVSTDGTASSEDSLMSLPLRLSFFTSDDFTAWALICAEPTELGARPAATATPPPSTSARAVAEATLAKERWVRRLIPAP